MRVKSSVERVVKCEMGLSVLSNPRCLHTIVRIKDVGEFSKEKLYFHFRNYFCRRHTATKLCNHVTMSVFAASVGFSGFIPGHRCKQ